MLTVYQNLLRLYPAQHRAQFGEEMLAVFQEVRADHEKRSLLQRSAFSLREIVGLMSGAIAEHMRAFFGFQRGSLLSTRRFNMRNGFRFPKSTAILMIIILAGVLLAIKRGEDIALSLPHVNPQIAPIVPMPSTQLLFFALFYAAGMIVGGILFALSGSGFRGLAKSPDQQG